MKMVAPGSVVLARLESLAVVLVRVASFAFLTSCAASGALPPSGHRADGTTAVPPPSVPQVPAPPEALTYKVIPWPSSLTSQAGSFVLSPTVRLLIEGTSDPQVLGVAGQLADLLRRATSLHLTPELVGPETPGGQGAAPAAQTEADASAHSIRLRLDPSLSSPEAYRLRISATRIELQAKTAHGLFNGVQTLRQLAPRALESPTQVPYAAIVFPAVEITDAPRFAYRGAHLDVSRHFFPASFVKKFIDSIAMFKLNTFHWHLTDDQGWRIEIKKYPKLTQVGGWRAQTLAGHFRDQPQRFDGQRYGGFYTQAEIQDVVRYAAERFVTVIPEIELPGHSLAALAAYPELGCTPGPFAPATTWGIFDEIYCPKEETFQFLEHVFSEVLALFPSTYIHIGGDEVPKTRWRASALAQDVMRRQGLKNEEQLQGYFVGRIGDFLKSKGRRLIGWDEIAEGGLPRDATVMAWRTREAALHAAQAGHDVVLALESDLYLNYYQDNDIENEPLAFGGYTPVERVYGFDPLPQAVDPAVAQHVLGAEACLWTEYVKTPELAEYMAFPRLQALAEVLWSPKAARSWDSFAKRLPESLARLEQLGIRHGRHIFKVKQTGQLDATGRYTVALTSYNNDEIRFTLDGSTPDQQAPLYNQPLVLTGPTTVSATSFAHGKALSRAVSVDYFVNLATGKRASYQHAFSAEYPGQGELTLTDGIKGSEAFGDGRWLGFDVSDLDALLDLGAPRALHKLVATFLRDEMSWILLPRVVEFEVSDDGKHFRSVGRVTTQERAGDSKPLVKDYALDLKGLTARYVRIKAPSAKLPAWHPGRGNPAWLFVSELSVE